MWRIDDLNIEAPPEREDMEDDIFPSQRLRRGGFSQLRQPSAGVLVIHGDEVDVARS